MFWINILFVTSLGISVLSSSTMVYEAITDSETLTFNTTADSTGDKVREHLKLVRDFVYLLFLHLMPVQRLA